MNESEPLMKFRKNDDPIKTVDIWRSKEEYSGYLFTGYAVGVIKEA